MSNKTTTLDEAIAKITANKQECSICYKPLIDRTATLKCNHTFHKDCLAIWAGNPKQNQNDRNKTCPVCRGHLEVKLYPGNEYVRKENNNGGRNKTVRRNNKNISRKMRKSKKNK
jgi:hypothetical protein